MKASILRAPPVLILYVVMSVGANVLQPVRSVVLACGRV